MNKKMNSFSFAVLVIIMIVASFLGTGIYSIIKASGVDAYLSIILGSILGIISLIVFITLFNYEPSLPINKKINKLLGKTLGTIVNGYLLIKAFLIGVTIFYNLLNFTSTQFLSETPAWLIGIAFVIIVSMANIKGIKAISYTATIIFFINIFLLISALIPLSLQIDFSNLLPFMNKGISPVLKGSIYFFTLNIMPLYSLLIIPKNKFKFKNEKKTIFLSYFTAIIVALSVITFTIAVLGIFTAQTYMYPEYIVLKRINIFNFIDRVEDIVMLQWIFGLFISLSVLIYYITQTIKTKKSKLLPTLLSLIILFVSLKIFNINILYLKIIYNYLPYARLLTFIIFVILAIITIKKKKNSSNLN